MAREEILSRYRHLRAISSRHLRAALDFLPRGAILEYAKRLGMLTGNILVAETSRRCR
ncbi:MAG TPA: hypothetical protein VJ770_09020 [Stellaceae bacterium]|nr:hypothetical protein [Stellaceae bacterium]